MRNAMIAGSHILERPSCKVSRNMWWLTSKYVCEDK